MTVSATPQRTGSLPLLLLQPALIGALLALTGAYLDDAWHTSRGRDSFFIAPHVAIYGGVSLIGAVLSLWTARRLREAGAAALRREPELMLAVIALVATLVSAPIDNAWHVAFGRDAVLWSPPHLLGIVGTTVLGAALLLQTPPGAWRWLGGGLVLAGGNFVVAEYETDVPQFSGAFYLPVLVLAAIVTITLVRLASPSDRWAASRAAVVQLAFVTAVAAFLRVIDFAAPSLPIVLGAAVALDLTRRRSVPVQAAAMLLALLALLAVRRGLGADVVLTGQEVLIGAGLGLVLALAALGGLPRRLRAGSGLALAMTGLLLLPALALAHDPGQGDAAGTARLAMVATGREVAVSGRLTPCRALRAGRLDARRAGRRLTAPLRVDNCRFRGSVRVDGDGRWFVYANLASAGGRVETWLPVPVGDGTHRAAAARRFAYVPDRAGASAAKAAAAVVIYLAVVVLLIATVAVAGRAARHAPAAGAAA